MKRVDIINRLIKNRNYSSYLEIGIWGGRSNPKHNNVVCEKKVGIDPDTNFKGDSILAWTSDQYFEFLYTYTNGVEFDIIFIDGLHLEEQVDKDIENSLNFLASDGLIIMHDCSPPTEWHAREKYDGGQWNGTVYKSLVKLRCENPNLYIETVDTDWGCGIIDPSRTQDVFSQFSKEEINKNFKLFNDHRTEILNLISVDDFLLRY